MVGSSNSVPTRSGILALAVGALLLLAGCSEGIGDGQVVGQVWAPGCGLEGEPFDLRPTFFVADPFEDFMSIRVQRGSDFEDRTNGVSLGIRAVSEVKAILGVPIDLADPIMSPPRPHADAPLVAMNLYLNRRCPIDRSILGVNYEAVEGQITFDAIYSPRVDNSLEIAAHFTDVLFVDRSSPMERRAVLSGDFTFLFNRGRPAQRFP